MADLDEVYRLINKKDSRDCSDKDKPPLERTVKAYTKVVQELLSKPRARTDKSSWVVKESVDFFSKEKYVDVCFSNPKYVGPPKKGLKPWGGKNPPKGHYNMNDNRYNEYFSAGWASWSKSIDLPVVNKTKYSLERVVAEILWELTWNGWTEEESTGHINTIKDSINQARKEIKQGKCVKLPPKKKGGMTVVIPDIVSQQLVDIVNKESKKKNKYAP